MAQALRGPACSPSADRLRHAALPGSWRGSRLDAQRCLVPRNLVYKHPSKYITSESIIKITQIDIEETIDL